MTEIVLGLVPDYGLYLVFSVVMLACLAAPLPASMLVLAAGSFAAAGDLVLWQVFAVASLAFIAGDQVAYGIARSAGPVVLGRLRQNRKIKPIIARSEDLLERKGGLAVLLSHTVVSPTCPYVSYLCGAGGMSYFAFSGPAIIGAILWTTAYVGLGYTFADQLTQVSEILSNFFGFVIAGVAVVGSAIWLRRQWKNNQVETV